MGLIKSIGRRDFNVGALSLTKDELSQARKTMKTFKRKGHIGSTGFDIEPDGGDGTDTSFAVGGPIGPPGFEVNPEDYSQSAGSSRGAGLLGGIGRGLRSINGKKLNSLAPYASNIANSFRKLPAPITPNTEPLINPSYVNLDSSRNDIRRLQRNANVGLDYKLGNSAVAQALKGQTLATAIEGMNDVNQRESSTNAQIGNQASFYNSFVNARNTDRMNDFNQNLVSRTANQQRLNSENLANFGDKIQMQTRDRNLMNLENRKLDNLPLLYNDSGVFNRNLVPATNAEYYDNEKALGGSLLSKYYGYGGKIRANSGMNRPKGKYPPNIKRGMSIRNF